MPSAGLFAADWAQVTSLPFKQDLAQWLIADPMFMDGLRKGLADLTAGRIRPWTDIQRELSRQKKEEKP